MVQLNSNGELYHYGILGMKWGVRRYQNEDGSLTAAGYRHYGKHPGKATNDQLRQVRERADLEAQIARSLGKQPGQKGFVYEKGKNFVNKLIDKKIEQWTTKLTTKNYDFTNLDPTRLTNPSEIATIATAIKNIKSIKDTTDGMSKQEQRRFEEDYNKFKNAKDSRDVLGKDLDEYEWFMGKVEGYKTRKAEADSKAKEESDKKQKAPQKVESDKKSKEEASRSKLIEEEIQSTIAKADKRASQEASTKKMDEKRENEALKRDAKTQREARNYMNGMRDTLISDFLKK